MNNASKLRSKAPGPDNPKFLLNTVAAETKQLRIVCRNVKSQDLVQGHFDVLPE